MNYLEHIAEQEVEEQRVLHEHALKGDFESAIRGFGAVIGQLYHVPEDVETEVSFPCDMAQATAYRDSGFTYFRRFMYRQETRERDIVDAYEDMDMSDVHAGRWVEYAQEFKDEYTPEKIGKIMAVHGLTLGCLARMDAALLSARKQGRDDDNFDRRTDMHGNAVLGEDRARELFAKADDHLVKSNSSYGAVSNAVRAAVFERGAGGNVKDMAAWLHKAGTYILSGVEIESTKEDRQRAVGTLANNSRVLHSQKAALAHMTNWRTV